MVGPIYSTGTEYLANAVTMLRGIPADVLAVYVYHSTDPNPIPTFADFTTAPTGAQVQWITSGPLQEGTLTDVLSLVGPGEVSVALDPGEVELTAGNWQRFVAVRTADEFIIRKIDVVEVL